MPVPFPRNQSGIAEGDLEIEERIRKTAIAHSGSRAEWVQGFRVKRDARAQFATGTTRSRGEEPTAMIPTNAVTALVILFARRERAGAPHRRPVTIATVEENTRMTAVRVPLRTAAAATIPIDRNTMFRFRWLETSRKPAVPIPRIIASARYSARRPGLTKIEFGSVKVCAGNGSGFFQSRGDLQLDREIARI